MTFIIADMVLGSINHCHKPTGVNGYWSKYFPRAGERARKVNGYREMIRSPRGAVWVQIAKDVDALGLEPSADSAEKPP